MEILQRIMSLVTASALLLSGCGINDTSEKQAAVRQQAVIQ